MISADLIIEEASEVVTCVPGAGTNRPGEPVPPASAHGSSSWQSDAGSIANAIVACAGDRIVFVGTAERLAEEVALAPGGARIDAGGGVVLPGFVDAHTHLPFGGWREGDFERRLAGTSYSDIAAAGGGILSTVRATRALEPDQLESLIRQRCDAMLANGTTTIEAKTGYELSAAGELETLRALGRDAGQASVVPTLLGAHLVPPEHRDNRARYVDIVCKEMIPVAAAEKIARFCDVFVEDGAFTIQEAERIFTAARDNGLGLRAHAEQLTRTGAAALAATMGAASVDHLERLSAADVEVLARSWRRSETARPAGAPTLGPRQQGTVAVVLPGAAYFLRETARPPVRGLIEAGVPVALATDFNPGTSPCLAMPPILNLACVLFGFSPDEAIVAATRVGALSLGMEAEIGTIEVGKRADLAIWNVPDRRHLAYRFGPLPAPTVIKGGRVI